MYTASSHPYLLIMNDPWTSTPTLRLLAVISSHSSQHRLMMIEGGIPLKWHSHFFKNRSVSKLPKFPFLGAFRNFSMIHGDRHDDYTYPTYDRLTTPTSSSNYIDDPLCYYTYLFTLRNNVKDWSIQMYKVDKNMHFQWFIIVKCDNLLRVGGGGLTASTRPLAAKYAALLKFLSSFINNTCFSNLNIPCTGVFPIR